MTKTNANTGKFIGFALVIVLAIMAYGVLTMPDNRTTGERLSDAAKELPNGVDNAAHELEDRTPGEKAGDAVKDMGESIKARSK